MATGWRGKRVTVMGLGTRGGGSGVARYLAESGAKVTVTDMRAADQLGQQIEDLSDLDIRYTLGRHEPSDFSQTDAVVRNPAVRRANPFLSIARDAGVPIEMEMTIFLRACPGTVIGITGTKGKTSTSAICGEMVKAFRPDTVVAGNMGISALGQLPLITRETIVVLEISSWQLEAMDEQRLGPDVAVLTNISEDHLDTYRDFDDYADTKRSIAHHLMPGNTLILNDGDAEVARTRPPDGVRAVKFGEGYRESESVTVTDKRLHSTICDRVGTVEIPDSHALRGTHQHLNAAAAAAAALVVGATLEHVAYGLRSFTGVANRMELVTEIDGVLYVNDTAATAPAAAIASLRAFADRRIHLISGGANKRLDFGPMAREIVGRASSVTLLAGTATAPLIEELRTAGWGGELPIVESMAAAVANAETAAKSGDVVLLSPGCASFGLFRDEFDRGAQFRELALARSAMVSS